MKYTLKVVTRLQDNGDGGYTMYVYNNTDELIADHPMSTEWDADFKKEIPVKLTAEQRDSILNEDDPYKNGYIERDSIEIDVGEDGIAKLSKHLSFHAGQ